jgi:integrase
MVTKRSGSEEFNLRDHLKKNPSKKRSSRTANESKGLQPDALIGDPKTYNPVVESTSWSDDITEVLGGKAVIYTTPTSGGRYYVRIWLPVEKKYLRKSLRTKDKTEAISKAEQVVIDTLSTTRAGYRVFSVTFEEMVNNYLANQRRRVEEGNITDGRLTTITAMMNNLLAYVGKETRVDAYKPKAFADYYDWRRKTKPNVTNSTLKNETAQINNLYRWGAENGYLNRDTTPAFRELKHTAPTRRPSFSTDHYRKLYTYLGKWDAEVEPIVEKTYRKMFREWILVAANTGLRMREQRYTRWRDVDVEKRSKASDSPVYITVQKELAKNGRERVAVGARGDVVLRWKKSTMFDRPTDYMFSDPETGQELSKDTLYRLWNEALNGAGLKEKGTPNYTFYSLRHYYATMRLQEGKIDVYTLSRVMGTSVKNIEDHYGQIITRNMGDYLTRRGE